MPAAKPQGGDILSSQGRWHPGCSTIGGRTHLPRTSFYPRSQNDGANTESRSAHSWCQLEELTSGTPKPSCSKRDIKHLQQNRTPTEADSSARDPSTGSAPQRIHHTLMQMPRPTCENWFPLPWHYQCVSPTETSFDNQKHPKTRSQTGEGGRFSSCCPHFHPACSGTLISSDFCRVFLFSPRFDSPLHIVREENGWL